MTRNISFALTVPQFMDGTKDVTRRLAWGGLQPGTELCVTRKCMGLKRGEKAEKLGLIRVVSVRQEPLQAMLDDLAYGQQECRREGFPNWEPMKFVDFFIASNKGCTRQTVVTRIEFARVGGS